MCLCCDCDNLCDFHHLVNTFHPKHGACVKNVCRADAVVAHATLKSSQWEMVWQLVCVVRGVHFLDACADMSLGGNSFGALLSRRYLDLSCMPFWKLVVGSPLYGFVSDARVLECMFSKMCIGDCHRKSVYVWSFSLIWELVPIFFVPMGPT